MNIEEICQTFFKNIKPKHLQYFEKETPEKNIIKGYICKKPNEFLGSLFITHVNDEETNQFIHSMPKINYYEHDTYDEILTVFHEKLDGSCLIIYPLYDNQGNVLEIIPKTRNTVIADEFIVDLLKKTYTYLIHNFYDNDKETVLIFELYGVANKHEIYNPNSYLSLILIGGYSIDSNLMLGDSDLNLIAFRYGFERPRNLFTIVKNLPQNVYKIININRVLELYQHLDFTAYPTYKDAIDGLKDYLTKINNVSLEKNGFMLLEGAVANTFDKNQKQRYLKLKPHYFEEKHKGNKIPRRTILKEVRKYWDEYGSQIESIYEKDKTHYMKYVQKNLLEEFSQELVDKSQTKRKIEAVFFNVWESQKLPAGLQDLCHKIIDNNPDAELGDLMRIFSKQYPYKKNQARLVYRVMEKIKQTRGWKMEEELLSTINTLEEERQKKQDELITLLNEQERTIAALYELEEQLVDEQMKKTEYENKLWLETDFKAIGCTNQKQRDAYVSDKMKELIPTVEHLKNDINYTQRTVNFLEKKILILERCYNV